MIQVCVHLFRVTVPVFVHLLDNAAMLTHEQQKICGVELSPSAAMLRTAHRFSITRVLIAVVVMILVGNPLVTTELTSTSNISIEHIDTPSA
jgi:hypothetical protein